MVHGVAASFGLGAVCEALVCVGALPGRSLPRPTCRCGSNSCPSSRAKPACGSLTGTLEAVDSVDLGFRQSGRISEMLVNEGDQFTAGQVLGRIDPLQLQQSLNGAMAALAAAEATEQHRPAKRPSGRRRGWIAALAPLPSVTARAKPSARPRPSFNRPAAR